MKTEVSSGTTIEYKYDDNGNLIERKENGVVTATYTWDDQNRLVRVELPNEVVTYAYDDDNIRVSETQGGVTTNYLLDKNRPYAQVWAEKEGAVRSQKKKKSEKLQEYEKEGDFDTANEDFDEIAEEFGVSGDIKEIDL